MWQTMGISLTRRIRQSLLKDYFTVVDDGIHPTPSKNDLGGVEELDQILKAVHPNGR